MLKNTISILGVLGALAVAHPAPISAQMVVAQGALVCLEVNEGRAIQERNPSMQLQEVLQRIGTRGDLVSAEFCRAPDNTLVWVITERNGGAIIRRVVDALTGAIVEGL